jgi:hypothetical protein
VKSLSAIGILKRHKDDNMLRFYFVTIIPLEFWAIVLLLLFMWAAFGLGGLVTTVMGLAAVKFLVN